MAGDNDPSPPTEASRKFLEEFLEQVRRADMPGAPELIAKIEKALGPKPGLSESSGDSPGESGDEGIAQE